MSTVENNALHRETAVRVAHFWGHLDKYNWYAVTKEKELGDRPLSSVTTTLSKYGILVRCVTAEGGKGWALPEGLSLEAALKKLSTIRLSPTGPRKKAAPETPTTLPLPFEQAATTVATIAQGEPQLQADMAAPLKTPMEALAEALQAVIDTETRELRAEVFKLSAEVNDLRRLVGTPPPSFGKKPLKVVSKPAPATH